MTSKVVPPAPRDPKTVVAADQSIKEDVKAVTTSGNEEPTNSSSAERVHPTTKKDKPGKGPSATPAAPSKPEPDDEKLEEQANGGRRLEPTPGAEIVKQQPISIKDLRKLARKPGKIIDKEAKEELTVLVDKHKGHDFDHQNSAQILAKRLRQRESASDPYRALLDQTEKLQEFGHRVQTPQIFEKTLQLPPRLPGLAIPGGTTPQTSQIPKLIDTSHTAGPGAPLGQAHGTGGLKGPDKAALAPKRTILPVLSREEASLVDYDFGLCSNQVELQKSQSKCFENMLDMINLTYFGTQVSIQVGATAPVGVGQAAATKTTNINNAAGTGARPLLNAVLQTSRQSDTQQPSAVPTEAAQQAKPATNLCLPSAADPSKRMKLSQLDYLANPLRTDHPFEIWSPKEMALFSACICQFGKRFDLFVPLIKSKTEQEIYEFYRCWKYTKYYRTWKLKSKDRPKHNVASLSDLVYHERQI